jgi:hypothetical protein
VATQATVQTRACGLGAKKLTGDGQQITMSKLGSDTIYEILVQAAQRARQ